MKITIRGLLRYDLKSITQTRNFTKSSYHRLTYEPSHLTKIFDNQKYFNKFINENSKTSLSPFSFKNTSQQTGLFKNELLSNPSGLIEFSKISLNEAKELVEDMSNGEKNEKNQLNYIKKLDQLSDILCRVIDVAEFIRVVHPSNKWINAAQQTHELVFEYMNQLNTNVELYNNLIEVLNSQNLITKLSDEEIKVGEYLKQDFERSGIHMDPQTRENFVAITQEISLLGSHFNKEMNNLDSYWCEITKEEFDSIEDKMIKEEILQYQSKYSHTKTPNSYYIPLIPNLPFSILTNCKSDSIRKKIWISLHNSSKEQIEILNKFISYRALLSKMLGYESYSHYQLEHKMAKSPKNVMSFLNNLQKSLKNKIVNEELLDLSKIKNENLNSKSNNKLNEDEIINNLKPWDRDYLINKIQSQNQQDPELQFKISEYFSIGTVIEGLNQLFLKLYNISLIPEKTLNGEVWDNLNVRKLKVMDNEKNQILGYLYLDFWSNKVLPSHFTIVCSRRINKWENIDDYNSKVQIDLKENYQLPIISLVCNFNLPSGNKPTLLTLDQVDTIFHEMGHAMHSMIGRTELHNLSGTRCATDFVEIPSVLMESFSKDLRVLSRISKHYKTGESIPIELLENAFKNKNYLQSCETYMQSKMATLDQFLHNENIVKQLQKNESINSTKIYHEIESNLKIFKDIYSTWHGKFPHLFSYGSVYYSYLLDRAIAEKLWKNLFAQDPFNSNSGLKYKNDILKWGGTKDPWLCLSDALNIKELSKGDSNAMEIIGKDLTL
ncbi:OCT1 [Candida pseudojiufengensis]|uniref:OCT1 n=1 Tax=Candida pseudojiufengensis TaxID=497109 RepID=UPI002224D93D|nr:OCT1 [Candida pseudojiufengensis]KAI5962947.1 OCT1 [Candida pseudojiufengensis]